jgi:type IV pilus assembly protein PilA
MLYRLRQRSQDESGFTLIELLVVILIIGILAAIAIPSFLNQKSKASDASAKSQARTLETAAETYATDHNGEYGAAMTKAELQTVEPTLKDETVNIPSIPAVAAKSYTVQSENKTTGDKFQIVRKEGGEIERLCEPASESNKGGCPNGKKGGFTGTW